MVFFTDGFDHYELTRKLGNNAIRIKCKVVIANLVDGQLVGLCNVHSRGGRVKFEFLPSLSRKFL